MSDLDDLVADPVLRTRVGEHLTYLAATADVRRTPVEAIARRAATRRRRQRMAGATGAVAVVVGATVTALLALSSPRTIAPEDAPPTVDVPATTDPGSTPTSTPESAGNGSEPTTPTTSIDTTTTIVPSLQIEGAGARWGRVPVDATAEFVLDESESIVFDSDADVTWTVDADPEVVATLWLTDDGIAWRAAASTPALEPVAVVRDGPVIDVAGWTVAPLPPGFQVATTADGGATWSSRTVPLPDGVRPLVTSDAASVDLARLGGTVVVTVPDLVEGDGLDDPQMFAAVDGDAFVRVVLPAELDPQGTLGLELGAGALLATSFDTADLTWHLLRSTDGVTWARLGVLPYSQGQVGRVGDAYVALSSNATADGADVWSSDDGSSWTPIRLADIAGGDLAWAASPYGWVVDDGGLTLVAGAYSAATARLQLSDNGVTMLFDAGLNDMDMIDDVTGRTIGGYHDGAYVGPVRLGADTTLEVLDESGNVRASFTLDEATAAIDSAPQQTGTSEVAVFRTVDLVTWSTITITALFDQPAPFVASAGSVAGTVVFRFPDGGGDSHQVVVGTPI